MKKHLVWLASYPKSGNTWLRFLLANYLADAATPIRTDALEFAPSASLRVYLDEWSTAEQSEHPDTELLGLRCAFFRAINDRSTELTYFKAHEAWRPDTGAGILFDPAMTHRAILMVRNPLDIVESFARHFDVELTKAARVMTTPGYVANSSRRTINAQFPQRIGSWSEHLNSWLDESEMPLTLVRYEDLWAAPCDTFRHVVRCLGLPIDEDRIRRAVDHSSFERLAEGERVHGFPERVSHVHPFFRRGSGGMQGRHLPPELAERIINAHGAHMHRLGYDVDARI